jgi:hypothetical protein
MHHPLGYTVRRKGLHHVAFKNSYIVSGMLKGASGQLSELTSGRGALFSEFTRSWEQLNPRELSCILLNEDGASRLAIDRVPC